VIASPSALGRRLRPTLAAPTSVGQLLEGQDAYRHIRAVVHDLFPDAADEILAAREEGGGREAARVWAFCRKVEAELFPIHEGESYEQVAYDVPFVRNGWSWDRFHELDLRGGELLLLVLSAEPFTVETGTRTALLDAAERLVGRELVERVPPAAFDPKQLRAALDGTPYLGLADFADWLWAESDSVFLDADDEAVFDVPWTPENVAVLREHWARAEALMERVTALERWLEEAPAERFARLLDAALGQDPHANYLRARRHYDLEITEAGLVPVRPDEPLALPAGAA
jgi:hypothetical protein